MEKRKKKKQQPQAHSGTPAETQELVRSGPPGPGSALREQSRVAALAESSLAGMALVPAGGGRHAGKSPPQGHKGRGHAQAGSQQEFWEFSASLRKVQEYAEINMNSTVTYFLLPGSSSSSNPNPTQ